MPNAASEHHAAPVRCETESIAERAIASKISLRVWFAVGFVITFVALAMSVTTFIMAPDIGGVVQCKLWQYYLHEAERLLRNEPRMLGPFTEDPARVFVTAFQHALLAGLGGLMVAGFVRGSRRICSGKGTVGASAANPAE